MLELLQDRDSIQRESSNELGRKFHNFDIECVDVLIGKPDTQQAGGKIETLLEQLRLRQLSLEQVETYSKQVTAAQNLRVLNEAQAQAQMQTQLSNSMVQIKIAENEAEAQLARARKQAEQVVVTAEAESQAAHPGRSRRRCADLAGRFLRSLGLAPQDQLVLRPAALCPDDRGPEPGQMQPAAGSRASLHFGRRRLGGPGRRWSDRDRQGAMATNGVFGLLLNMLVAEKSGFNLVDQPGGSADLHDFTDQIAKQAMEAIQQAVAANGLHLSTTATAPDRRRLPRRRSPGPDDERH